MSVFSHSKFLQFTTALRIDTKELGRVRLGKHLMGTQTWLLKGITEALEDGVRNIVILKCRQAGSSTLCLALDLYWVFKFPGLSGALVTHDDKSRDMFKETLQLYYDGLPYEWRRELIKHNRNMFSFENRSRLQYMVAGTVKKKGTGALGRSAALAFVHATEMSSWGDEEGLASLRSSLAEHNPNRLYLWESTARGFNLFYDMWEEAKKAITQRAIFVSFWANEFYRAPKDGEIYNAYWGKKSRLTAAERSWVRDVKLLYDVTIEAEQVAWYRWMIVEKGGDELVMQQEHPPTEHHAFLATGSQFFSARSISEAIKATRNTDSPENFRIEVKSEFYETEVVGATPRMATLKLWEYPVTQAKCQYVLGADPRYGSEASHDTNSISVWRCYADRCMQVAEFADPDMPTYAFAWCMAFLAGYYEPCLVNLEINGPGQAVFDEMQKLRKKATLQLTPQDKKLWNVVRHMQNYLYKRVDQLSGVPNAFHTQTTYQSKDRYMNNFRDYFERGYAQPMSVELVNEMKGIVREAGSAPEASARSNDDRVTAAALAVHAWSEHLQIKLGILGITYAGSIKQELDQSKVAGQVGPAMVQNYLRKLGIR
jgi:hypothetical protein